MSTINVLVNARLPILNDYLSGSSQSILVEVALWAVVCLVYALIMSRVVRFFFSKLNVWQTVKKRGGVFCANAQDDMVLLVVWGCHHLTAGLICLYAASTSNATLWRHGYLLEVGFEVSDILAMIFSIYPYRLDNIKPDAQAGLLFHHLPGVLVSGMILNAGLESNEHLQKIAVWCLIGAAFSLFNGVYTYTLRLDTQMVKVSTLFSLNTLFWAYSRFYIFPTESYALIQDIQAATELSGTWLLNALYASGSFLCLFNTAVMLDIIPKCIRYWKRAFDGVTPLDTHAVPMSREDRMKQARRSSLSSMMGVNLVEDIHMAEMKKMK